MGDRGFAVVAFPSDDGPRPGVAVYTHWTGSSVIEDATIAAEAASKRAGDPSYFARIFIDQFTKQSRDEETGHGIVPVADVSKFDPEYNGGDYAEHALVDSQTGKVSLVKS